MPAQVTWRADDALIARIRLHADTHGVSMNEFITQVMRTVTDPTYAASASDQVRERLRAAGLLVAPPAGADLPRPVDWDEVATAGRAAATGTPLADLVIEGR